MFPIVLNTGGTGRYPYGRSYYRRYRKHRRSPRYTLRYGKIRAKTAKKTRSGCQKLVDRYKPHRLVRANGYTLARVPKAGFFSLNFQVGDDYTQKFYRASQSAYAVRYVTKNLKAPQKVEIMAGGDATSKVAVLGIQRTLSEAKYQVEAGSGFTTAQAPTVRDAKVSNKRWKSSS